MKKIILFLLLTSSSLLTAQNSLAKIEYSYAEEAYSNNDYKKALEHLEEVKSLLGSTNARVMYLEIYALVNSISVSKVDKEDYFLCKKIYDLADSFLSNFENEAPFEKIKNIYEINKKYKTYIIEFDNLIKGKDKEIEEKYDDALLHYSIACDAGNAEACKNIGLINEQKLKKSINDGSINDIINKQSLMDKAFEKSAEQGSAEAKFIISYNTMLKLTSDKKTKEESLQLMDELYDEGTKSNAIKYAIANLILAKEDKAKKILYEAYNLNIRGAAGMIYLYYKDGDKDADLELITKAKKENLEDLKEHPESGYQHYLRYRILYNEQKYSEAFIHMEKACQKNIGRACYTVSRILGGDKAYRGWGQKFNRKKMKEYGMKAYQLADLSDGKNYRYPKYIFPLY